MNVPLFTLLKTGIALGFAFWLWATLSCFYVFYSLAGPERGPVPVTVVKDFGNFLNDKKGVQLMHEALEGAVHEPAVAAAEIAAPSGRGIVTSYLQKRELEIEIQFARQAVGGDVSESVLALAVANRSPPSLTDDDIMASQAAMVELRKDPARSLEAVRRALHRLENYEDGAAIRHTFLQIEASL